MGRAILGLFLRIAKRVIYEGLSDLPVFEGRFVEKLL